MILVEPPYAIASRTIPPNYSTWQTIELSHQCALKSIREGIPGDFVECGVAAGNNLAAMCLAGRHGYGFDSFQGIPWAGDKDDQQPGIGEVDKDKIGLLETSGVSSHSEENVRLDFEKWGISNYTLVKGWFQDTVKLFHRPIAVLRLDGDLYESTLICLHHLYPQLSKGGILIIDDWVLPGCKQAFYDYFNETNETPEMIFDNGITYWQK